MTPASRLLAAMFVDAGMKTLGDCSDATINRIDFRTLSRTLGGVIRCHTAGLIGEEQALLFARVHCALAALKAHSEGRNV